MSKFIDAIKNFWLFKTDKLLHQWAAALIVAVVFILLDAFKHPNWGFWVGNLAAFLALVAKEAFDYFHPDKYLAEFLDVLAGLTGIFLMDFIILFQFIIK